MKFIIELRNFTDCADNECYTINAKNIYDAKEIAYEHCPLNYHVGDIYPIRPKNKIEKEIVKRYKTYCVGSLN